MGWLDWLRGKRADAAPPARAASVEQPMLMLDTGGHMAMINGIAFTPDGRQLVSASEDKTIRVWDLASGKTVRTIRGESAPGHAGKVFAMALSPDGKWLAAGGWMDKSVVRVPSRGDIRLYEFASGKLVALLKGHENGVIGLAFSSDGRKLISGSTDSTAILWDTGSLSRAGTGIRSGARGTEPKLLHRLEGHKDDIYAVGFSTDGSRAVTGSFDHDLRLWRVADGNEIAHMTGHGDKVQSLAMSPDGTVASGDWSGEIWLWDARDGKFLRTLRTPSTGVGSLSFSADGRLLLAASGSVAGKDTATIYDTLSWKQVSNYTSHDNMVIATAFSPDGRWAATGGGDNMEVHLWDPHSGKPRPGPDGKPPRLAGQGLTVWAAGFSADGRRVGWGNSGGWANPMDRGPLEQALTLPLGAPAALAAAEAGVFRRAQASFGGFSLSHRKGGAYGGDAILDISKDGRAVASIERGPTDGYQHRSYSFTPDGETVISGGSNGWLTAYDRAGNRLGDFVGHEGDIMAVAPSPDGRFLVSGAADQTVRLWSLKTRELLVTLFCGADGEWVMWTPEGFYTGSPEGDDLVGWQINHGPEREADYIRAAQLARRLYRPDIVARAIELASTKDALAEFGAPANIIGLLRVSRPPEFLIVKPAHGSTHTVTPAAVVIELTPNPDPQADIRVTVNGRQIAAREANPAAIPDADEWERRSYSVPLHQGANEIAVTARNEAGETTHTVALRFDGHSHLDQRGTLFILAVGVDDYDYYPNASLRFAAKDARAFHDHMVRHSGPLHKTVESKLLVKGGDAEPTRDNIENALALFRKARAEDTVVLFLAGHGTSEPTDDQFSLVDRILRTPRPADYLFLPQNAHADGEHWLPTSVAPWTMFERALQNAQGLRLMFVDTCHAHGAYDPRMVHLAGTRADRGVFGHRPRRAVL